MLEFKRKERVEERAKESGAVKGKSCEDYPWTELCENVLNEVKLTCSRTKQVLKPPRAEAAFEEQQE